MKKLFLLLFLCVWGLLSAQLPKPEHVVIVLFQNKDYSSIVGSTNAPYINSLISDSSAALFTQSYALVHPSQPNYLMLFSGSNQGVSDDNVPGNTPFTTCNLGASLLSNSHTFTGYCESMPSQGYLGSNTNLYYRKHNPWSDWQGTGPNTLPPSTNQPFSSFPSNYDLLPDVSIIVPNIINCMHDGTVQQGDNWLKNNLGTYVTWAKSHNSLLIVTFDEDGYAGNNHIFTLFLGQMVRHGSYNNHIDHYTILRTIEDMYKLPACGESASHTAIDFVWKSTAIGVKEKSKGSDEVTIWPVPTREQLNVTISSTISENDVDISLIDLTGKSARKKKIDLTHGENRTEFNTRDLPRGVYFLTISGKDISLNKKVVIE